MTRDDLVFALRQLFPDALAKDLADSFLAIRQDVATQTLGRAAPGHFVESVVQALQQLERGSYDGKPAVDAYLQGLESRASALDEALRVCAVRVGRAMYSLRSKRSIAHKNAVDPSLSDLRFLFAAAQWLLGELLRHASGISADDAARLLSQIEAPVGGLVEDFGGKRLVLANCSTRDEILILLHSHYPDALTLKEITEAADRRGSKTVANATRSLWREKLLEGTGRTGYRLTSRGFRAATDTVMAHLR